MSKRKVEKKPEIRRILAGNIKYYRTQRKMTQQKLAEKAGIAEQTIKNFEKGRTWGQDYTVSAIAKSLKIKVYELYVPQPEAVRRKHANTFR